jgi:hypothetical protein
MSSTWLRSRSTVAISPSIGLAKTSVRAPRMSKQSTLTIRLVLSASRPKFPTVRGAQKSCSKSVMPRLRKPSCIRGSAVVTAMAARISGYVTKGWAPGISLNDASFPPSRSTTASNVAELRRSTAFARRSTGSPGFHASTSALDGSSSEIDASSVRSST